MAVETSKLVRKTLKKAYPRTKFSVTSKSGVRVKWTDGPNKKQVEKILGPFNGKSFDGMDDSTHYHHSWLFADGTVQWAKRDQSVPEGAEEVCFSNYLFTNRGYSRSFIEKDAAAYSVECGWPAPEIKWFKDGCQYIRDWEAEQEGGEPIFRWFDEHLSEQTEYPEEEAAEAVSSVVEVEHEAAEAPEKEAACPNCCYYQSARCPGVADMAGCDDFDNPNALVALEETEGDPGYPSPTFVIGKVVGDLTVKILPKRKPTKKVINPTIEPLNIGPCPEESRPAMHWTGRQLTHLLGEDWIYEGDSENRSCDIMHKDGYGIHFYIQDRKHKVSVSGNWPRLTDEFHVGGFTFTPNDKDKPGIGFTAGRDPVAVLRDINRRFLPDYLEQYPKCVQNRDKAKACGIKRKALLENLISDLGADHSWDMWPDRAYLRRKGALSWGTITVDYYGCAEANRLGLPKGREVMALQVIKSLFPSTNKDPVLAQLEGDRSVIKASLDVLQAGISETSRSGDVIMAIEQLEDAQSEVQNKIDHYCEHGDLVGYGMPLWEVPAVD